jgi:hypothetical protein
MAVRAGASSLGGAWDGLYFYQGNGAPISFIAALTDAGASFNGMSQEAAILWTGDRATLYALLEGDRLGSSVSFVKTYDGTAGWRHSVRYRGTLNAAATEIQGRWSLQGRSGTFIMCRAGTLEEAEQRQAQTPVEQR